MTRSGEVAMLIAAAAALLGAADWIRRRVRLVAQLERFARRLAEGDAAARPPDATGTPLAGLVQALTALATQLAWVRASEKGRLELALRLSDAVLEAMPDPVLVVAAGTAFGTGGDGDGEATITRFNSAASRLLGPALKLDLPVAQLGNPLLQLAAEEASIGFPLASNQVPRLELARDGLTHSFRVRALPLSGGASGAVLVLQDESDGDAEAALLRLAAQSALFELRPLVDALGVALLGGDQALGVGEWRRIDELLRDHEAAGAKRSLAAVDLAGLVDEAVQAVGLEAQRRGVEVVLRVQLPAPLPRTEPLAVQRLLLRLLRTAVTGCQTGQRLTVEVRGQPRPQVRIEPGNGTPRGGVSPVDSALLERAQAMLVEEPPPGPGATVLRFSD